MKRNFPQILLIRRLLLTSTLFYILSGLPSSPISSNFHSNRQEVAKHGRYLYIQNDSLQADEVRFDPFHLVDQVYLD